MKFIRQKPGQAGMSMIELMVAIAIFMLITAAIFFLYIQSNLSYNQDERAARMQENGRFALNMIAADLTMLDFWGEMIDVATIDASVFAGAGDECDTDLRDPTTALLYYKHDAGTPLFDPTGCAAINGTIKANTNAVAIKRVDNKIDTTPSNGIIYLRTNGFTGAFIDDADTVAPPAGFNDWGYVPHLYFIRDDTNGTPFLCRAVLVNSEFIDEDTPTTHANSGNMDFDTVPADCLAEGVEQIHLEFGIDTNNDGVANQYLSDITAAQADTAVSARVYLLVRSSLDLDYTNDKTYNLGHLAALGPFNDNYYRRVYSTTVALRNPRAFILLAQ